MEILYFINQITNSGGIERIVIDKINYLANNPNISVSLAYYGSISDKPFYSIDEKVKLYPITANVESHSFVKKVLNIKKVYSSVNKIINAVKPNVIINANVWVISYFLPFIHRNIPKIIELHFSYDGLQIMNREIYQSNKLKIFINEELRRLVYPRYSKCIVLTNDDRKKWAFKNIAVIPNFTNIKRNENTYYTREKIAINVGRLEYQKNHEALLNAWSIISKKYPEWKLEIWGNGSLEDSLKNQIKHLGLEKNAFLKGTCSEIAKQYQRASFFVLSSRYEGLPLVVIEAMQMGLPCVCYAITGTNDIIKDGENGYIVQSNSITALSEGMEKMIRSMDEFESFSKRAEETAKQFEKNSIMKKWCNLFYELSNTSEIEK